MCPAVIFSTKPAELKDELQKKIVEHGGNFMQKIPSEELDRIVIASEYKGAFSLPFPQVGALAHTGSR